MVGVPTIRAVPEVVWVLLGDHADSTVLPEDVLSASIRTRYEIPGWSPVIVPELLVESTDSTRVVHCVS